MVTSIIKEKKSRESKLDFAADATVASLIAGAINTPVLYTLFIDKHSSLLTAIESTLWHSGKILLLGLVGVLVGGIALRILIYFLFYSQLDANEKTARTMAGGSLILLLVVLAHFHLLPSCFPHNYQTFAFYTFPMLLAFNAYTWYWNIWGASNIYFKGIQNAKECENNRFRIY